MKWNRWTRAGFAILAPVLVGGVLIAGEWAQSPASAQSDSKAATSEAAKPKAGAASKAAASKQTPEHVRELQQALAKAGYDPGPIDGIFGPQTKAALRKYVAVPPPKVPSPEDKTIAQFRTGEQRQGQ
jgi:peptidoglycan hydrolase-like protein with peptidoglycan-binding domain